MGKASGKCRGGEASLGQSRLASAATTLPSPPSAPVSNADDPATVPVSNADGPATNHAQSAAVGGGAADDGGDRARKVEDGV